VGLDRVSVGPTTMRARRETPSAALRCALRADGHLQRPTCRAARELKKLQTPTAPHR